ncbi:hypothetical protein I4549_17345 [Proteus mirabilis]|nr:hypothetical protein [Proteus mirabilis]
MPLYPNALEKIRNSLESIARGERPPVIAIGELTDAQFNEIRRLQQEAGLSPLEEKEILFMGRHNYNSRVKDGYTIDDILLQIESALSVNSIAQIHRGTFLLNEDCRSDGYGNQVNDKGVLEMTQRKPKCELFSTIPKGDNIKPNSIQKVA